MDCVLLFPLDDPGSLFPRTGFSCEISISLFTNRLRFAIIGLLLSA